MRQREIQDQERVRENKRTRQRGTEIIRFSGKPGISVIIWISEILERKREIE